MFEIKLKEAGVNPFLPICYLVGMVFAYVVQLIECAGLEINRHGSQV